MITIPETRKSLDPDHPGVKYTMPMWIQIDVSVGEWHKTSTGTVTGQDGAGVSAESPKGWGQLWVLGAALQFQGKKLPWKAGSYLCLTQPAEQLCVMRVYNSEARLSLSAPTDYFFFISKVRIHFFQIIHKRKCYCQQLSSFPINYISNPQDSKIISSQKSYPKDKSEWENTECSCLWVADCKRIYRTEIISSLPLLLTTASTTYKQ